MVKATRQVSSVVRSARGAAEQPSFSAAPRDLSTEARHEALPVDDHARHLATAHEQPLHVLGTYREPQQLPIHPDKLRVRDDSPADPGCPDVFEVHLSAYRSLVCAQVSCKGGDRCRLNEREQAWSRERWHVAASHRRRGIVIADEQLRGRCEPRNKSHGRDCTATPRPMPHPLQHAGQGSTRTSSGYGSRIWGTSMLR